MSSVYKTPRYSEFRKLLMDIPAGDLEGKPSMSIEKLQALNADKWFTYHRGHLAIARAHNKEVDLMARLVYGLTLSGAVITMQKRDEQGVVSYMLWPTRKIGYDDLAEAMALNPPPTREQREYMNGAEVEEVERVHPDTGKAPRIGIIQ